MANIILGSILIVPFMLSSTLILSIIYDEMPPRWKELIREDVPILARFVLVLSFLIMWPLLLVPLVLGVLIWSAAAIYRKFVRMDEG